MDMEESQTTASTTDFGRENLNEDVDRMKTLWINETNSPEVMPYDDEMITIMMEQIKNQQDYVDSVYDEKEALTEEKAFINKLYQMEIDRLKFMMSSYLRTRLRKIERFALHLFSDPVLTERLSPKEVQFAKQYVMLFENHVNELALAKFPDDHRSITSDGMILQPDLDSFVFCESKDSQGELQCDDQGLEHIPMRRGDRHVLRYRAVKDELESGRLVLL